MAAIAHMVQSGGAEGAVEESGEAADRARVSLLRRVRDAKRPHWVDGAMEYKILRGVVAGAEQPDE